MDLNTQGIEILWNKPKFLHLQLMKVSCWLQINVSRLSEWVQGSNIIQILWIEGPKIEKGTRSWHKGSRLSLLNLGEAYRITEITVMEKDYGNWQQDFYLLESITWVIREVCSKKNDQGNWTLCWHGRKTIRKSSGWYGIPKHQVTCWGDRVEPLRTKW